MTPWEERNDRYGSFRLRLAEYERAVRENIGVAEARMKMLAAMRIWEEVERAQATR